LGRLLPDGVPLLRLVTRPPLLRDDSEVEADCNPHFLGSFLGRFPTVRHYDQLIQVEAGCNLISILVPVSNGPPLLRDDSDGDGFNPRFAFSIHVPVSNGLTLWPDDSEVGAGCNPISILVPVSNGPPLLRDDSYGDGFNPRFAFSIHVPVSNGPTLWSDGSEAEAGFNPLISQAPIKKKRMPYKGHPFLFTNSSSKFPAHLPCPVF